MTESRQSKAPQPPDWTELTDLACCSVGGCVIFATDEWFAPSHRMLLESSPIFNDEFTPYGKWMDGWESRRKRLPGHDWCIIKLGLPGRIHGIEIDTAFFTGNQAPSASVQAAWLDPEPASLLQLGVQWKSDRIGKAAVADELRRAEEVGSQDWVQIVPVSPLKPGYNNGRRNFFAVQHNEPVTHLRLNMYPDGGIARLRVPGVVERSWDRVPIDQEVDLVSAENGGIAIGCSDCHFGEPRNLIKPGRGVNMGDGWETARKPTRPPVVVLGEDGLVQASGSDWAVLKMGVVGEVTRLVLDTNHFKGNFPQSFSVEGCLAPAATKEVCEGGITWKLLMPRTRAGPDREHTMELAKGDLLVTGPLSHLKLSIFPDGGVMRLRAYGHRALRCKL
ncbi:unnamed protein product [Discosporangium mesarthrocarpum]